jgi:hypothetical protein
MTTTKTAEEIEAQVAREARVERIAFWLADAEAGGGDSSRALAARAVGG